MRMKLLHGFSVLLLLSLFSTVAYAKAKISKGKASVALDSMRTEVRDCGAVNIPRTPKEAEQDSLRGETVVVNKHDKTKVTKVWKGTKLQKTRMERKGKVGQTGPSETWVREETYGKGKKLKVGDGFVRAERRTKMWRVK